MLFAVCCILLVVVHNWCFVVSCVLLVYGRFVVRGVGLFLFVVFGLMVVRCCCLFLFACRHLLVGACCVWLFGVLLSGVCYKLLCVAG